MKPVPLFCTSSVLIRNGKIIRNGKTLLHEPGKNPAEFLRAGYDLAGAAYPKFFKMDNLCKLAWLSAELLCAETSFKEGYEAEQKGIFLQNASSSLDTDLKHAESISNTEAYFPSPAVFVYTLANISAGEICIRQQIKGSSAFFIFEAFEADFLLEQVQTHMNAGRIEACIFGITEWIGNQYEACLFMVEKRAENKTELTSEFINRMYNQS